MYTTRTSAAQLVNGTACAHHQAGTCAAACSNTPAGACCRGQQGIPPAARHAASEVFSVLVEALLKDAEHGAADDEGGSLSWPVAPGLCSTQDMLQQAGGQPDGARTDSLEEAETPNSSSRRTAECCVWGASAICHGLGCAAITGHPGAQSWLAHTSAWGGV